MSREQRLKHQDRLVSDTLIDDVKKSFGVTPRPFTPPQTRPTFDTLTKGTTHHDHPLLQHLRRNRQTRHDQH